MSDGFVGREKELGQFIALLLRPARLVTLVGPGGIGKTRLAAEAVHRYRSAKGQSVQWVRLARLKPGSDATAVENEIAQSVVGADFSNRSAWDSVVDALLGTPSVLVLDNCEHLHVGAGETIERLLEAVPELTVVATSRHAIGWVDEHLIRLEPLAHKDAVMLFRQRAELTGRPVTSTSDIATVDAICQHMDNHPLYVRLAAARLVRRPLTTILAELSGEVADDQRLTWADGPRFGADLRHRAVADVVTWSYDLCTPQERVLFERMSVFAAGYVVAERQQDVRAPTVGVDVEAITAVCADDESMSTEVAIPSGQIEDLLDNLVNQSLVTAHIGPSSVRYSLVECLRVFAAARLRERSTSEVDEPAQVARRYMHYYRDKVGFAAANWFSVGEQDLLDWAVASWDNIRTSTDLSISTPGASGIGLEICAYLMALRLPFVMGSFRETRRLAERALAATEALPDSPVELRVATMASVAMVAMCQGELDVTSRLLDDSVRLHLGEAVAQTWRDTADTDIGLPPAVEIAWGHELFAFRDPRAVTVLLRAGDKCASLGDAGGAAFGEMAAALAAALLWPPHEARALAEQFLGRTRATGSSWAKSWSELVHAIVLTTSSHPTAALELERQALGGLLAAREQSAALWAVHARAWSLARVVADLMADGGVDRRQVDALATETAQLLGGAGALRDWLGMDTRKLGPFHDETVRAEVTVRGVLGDTRYAAAEAVGALLRPERGEVHLFALGQLTPRDPEPDHPHAGAPWQLLSPAERDVATLAASGWTNTAIAARRGSSPKTVDAQMASVLHKLAITSRDDIMVFIPESLSSHIRDERKLNGTSRP